MATLLLLRRKNNRDLWRERVFRDRTNPLETLHDVDLIKATTEISEDTEKSFTGENPPYFDEDIPGTVTEGYIQTFYLYVITVSLIEQ